MHERRGWVWGGIVGASALASCAQPGAVLDVSANQRVTIARIAESYGQDLALLNDLLSRAMASRRVLLLGELHRELLTHGYITPGSDPEMTRLDADLGDADADNALLREVRAGRMRAEEARAFLADYALVLRLGDGGVLRDRMLARLAPIAEHDRAAASLIDAMTAHADRVATLLEDADANASAIASFGALEPGIDAFGEQTIREVWARTVLRAIDDEPRRDAAERLLGRVLAMGTEE